jgi:rhodanese-related sulfurtransferase
MMNLFSKTPTIAPKDAAQEVLKDNAQFIDVRTVAEYAGGHAKGTINIPLDELEAHTSEFSTSDEVYVICQTGGRSAQAVNILIAEGINAINVSGGTRAWRSDGLPIE